jgi:hypothetical protein
VVSKVGNFAIDLPDANVAIQISGTFGSRQEEAQRLGRILRPKADGSSAVFYSVVTLNSRDQDFAQRRQLFLTEQGYTYEIVEEKDLGAETGRANGARNAPPPPDEHPGTAPPERHPSPETRRPVRPHVRDAVLGIAATDLPELFRFWSGEGRRGACRTIRPRSACQVLEWMGDAPTIEGARRNRRPSAWRHPRPLPGLGALSRPKQRSSS